MGFAKIIIIEKQPLTHGVRTSSPTKSFMRIVRESQIRPDKYYLETLMHQTLGKNYGFNNDMPNVWAYGQLPPEDNNEENRQSPCPFNWSDDLYEVNDDNNDRNKGLTDKPADQPTTLTGTRVQEYHRTC